MIARQRYAIEQKVSQLTTNAKVWAGLPWEEGQAAYALDAIPGIKEAGWSCEASAVCVVFMKVLQKLARLKRLLLQTIQRPVYRTRGEVENVADDVRGKLVEALANIKKVLYCTVVVRVCCKSVHLTPPCFRASTRGRSSSRWTRAS
jgi:hypothetical protein